MGKKGIYENVMKIVFLAAASISVVAVFLICFFLFINGIPAMREIGLGNFILGEIWKPGNDIFGIFPMILGSIYVTGVAILVGVPIGLLTAIFMARFCPKKLHRMIKPFIDLLAGIPSVVYGLFGLVVLVPLIRDFTRSFGFHGNGNSILTAGLLLGMMILPTIISVSENSIRAVPEKYFDGALALGATEERSVFTVMVPAASQGIMAGVILGIGRAIGETMAVIMVAGNQARMPEGVLRGIRTLTANIVIEMGYAADLHRRALIATGVVLFVFVLMINILFNLLKGRNKE